MSDETIICADCGRSFIWSLEEQRFYRERNFERPKRCKACRERRKTGSRQGMQGGSPPPSAVSSSPSRKQPQPKRSSRPGTQQGAALPAWTRRADIRYAAATVTAAWVLAALLFLGLGLDAVLSWLISVNLATFAAYVYDKLIAGSGMTRVPERVLLFQVAIGGALGAWIGMQRWHHKTGPKKAGFRFRLWLIVAVQVALLALYLFVLRR